MTMNIDPMNTLMRFLPNEQRIIGSAQGLQSIQSGQLNQQLARQQIAQNEQAQNILAQQQNLANTRQNFIRLEGMIQSGADQETIKGLLIENIERAKASGGNPIDSIQALNALQAGGVPELAGFMNKHRPTFEQLGLLPARERAKLNFGAIDVAKFTPESIRLAQQTGQYGDLQTREGVGPPPKYLEELRAELRKNVGNLEEQASSLEQNFNKLQNLSGEIQKGNRTAVAQGMVALLKIGDPGSVAREAEVEAALATPNPVGAVVDVFRSGGASEDVIRSVIAKIDPINPQNVNVSDLLGTAQAMLEPNAVSIAQQYERQKTRGSEQLSEGGMQSIFSESRNSFFAELPGMRFEVQARTEEAQPEAVEQLDMTRQEAGSIVDQLAEELGF